MKFLSFLALSPFFLAAATYHAPAGSGRVNLVADKLVRTGALLQGRGHARVAVGGIVFQADEATLRSATGEVELLGHVQVTLPARADRSVFRFGSGAPATGQPAAIVTDKAVGLSAGRMVVKDGLLQASGNIVLRAPDAQLRSDELSMVLQTADATLRGHIQATGKAAHEGQLPEMPPEIMQ
ncbi:MAG TPA: hypothetical protein VME43_25180 [Bryobacteraceae bacterium]|nr:hypothetical protein [Bryobacteraceae bacterium]